MAHGGDARHDGDAHALAHQAADRIEAAQAHPVRQYLAAAARVVGDVFLQGAAFHQADEFLVRHVGQQRRLAARQTMVRRHHQRQRIMAKTRNLQTLQVGRIGQHADVAGAGAQGVGDFVAEALLQIHRHARVILEEVAQHGRQIFAEGSGVAQHPHMAPEPLPIVVQLAAHAVHLRQHQARVMRQRAPRRRGLHAAVLAQQQRHAQRLLHAADTLAGRRQRHVRTPRAGRDGTGFLHVEKEPQIGEVEAHGKKRSTPGSGGSIG